MDLARFDEVNQVVTDVAAAVRRMPGCQSFVYGVDRASGQTTTVSTWDTEEHARASRDAVRGRLPSRLQALGFHMDPPKFFEMTVS